MSDSADTLPPPPFQPSPDAVYICDTLLARIAKLEASHGKRLETIEKHLAAVDLNTKGAQGQIQSFGQRLNQVERSRDEHEVRLELLEAEDVDLNGGHG
jgi:hypothetical protein